MKRCLLTAEIPFFRNFPVAFFVKYDIVFYQN